MPIRALAPIALTALLALAAPAGAATSGTVGGFAYGELQDTTVGAAGCGTNAAGEPAIHVTPQNNVFLSSELGVGGGTEVWRGLGAIGGPGASACALEYRGTPNAASGFGASGGDTDLAIAGAPLASGVYRVYVASLNLASVSVSHSDDNGATFTNVPVQRGIPVDDREWIAAFGRDTSLLTYKDIPTNNIDVLRSDDGGSSYTQISRAIPDTDYKAQNNELGNLATDKQNLAGTVAGSAGPGFWAYQSFVAPSDSSGSNYNEAFLAVSNDGGATWSDRAIPCSTASPTTDLDHNFPQVQVGPSGDIWYSWSDDKNVFAAVSGDHGATWSCSGPISTNSRQAIFPWLAATSAGEDLVYYATPDDPTGSNPTYYVYFVQNLQVAANAWGTPQRLMPVHTGQVCEGGASCTGGRQLSDDFGVDTDQNGFAHIAYSHDAPDLGGAGSYTGYAVQTSGTTVGASSSATPGVTGGTGSAGGTTAVPTGVSGRTASGCSDRVAPISRFARRGQRASRHGLALKGASADRGCGRAGVGRVARVRVAVGHKVGSRCRFLRANGSFGPRVSCLRTTYLPARGTNRWTFRFRGRLPGGAYNVWVRGIDAAGNVERKAFRRDLRRMRIR